MSKIIENFLVPLFVILSVLYAFNSFGNDGPILLNKVYHHTSQNPVHIERANISCYFSGDVQVQEMKNNKHCTAQSYTFFFPNVVINPGECESMIQHLSDYNDSYTVTIKEVSKPVKGILIVFNFSHDKFALKYEQFDSIGLQKGVVFRLYNKELLKVLEHKNYQPVLRTLWQTNKPCIAIDPGHGGTDCGATAHGIQEKDICLAIGAKVGNLLEQHGFSVVLTRNNDYNVGLDERTSHANNCHADLFVSIHANWAPNQGVQGVETFFLKPSLLKKKFSQLVNQEQDISTAILDQRTEMSQQLAHAVQHQVCDAIAPFHKEPIDRKVKSSVSQILLGTQMPAVLVEVGFVSNKKEALLLPTSEYQDCIAHGICDGILSVFTL